MPKSERKKLSKVAIAGAGGLLGARLCTVLQNRGFQLYRLLRPTSDGQEVTRNIDWDPGKGLLNPGDLEGVDAVIHLGGANVAGGRWSEARKNRIVESRLKSTLLLSRTLAELKKPPRVFVCASAIGFYGNRGDALLSEDASPGEGFLADLAIAWEAATAPALEAGVRVVNARIGVVLAEDGGALAKMLTPFKMGLGGKIGDGRQYMSWIAIEDVVRAILFCLERDAISGPVNLVAPRPVTNQEFTQTLGRVLGRPTFFPLPAMVVRTIFGEMGQELLLHGARVSPAKLEAAGFAFQQPNLESALRAILK